MVDKIKELKECFENWERSVEVREVAYRSAQNYFKGAESRFKEAKKIKSLTYRDWRNARKEVIKAKSKLQRYPSDIRRWSKNNLGKVFNFMEKIK